MRRWRVSVERIDRRSAAGWTARARGAVRADRGSASLEFLTAGVILLVPTVYLVIALASIQSGGFAVEGAARQAARVFVQAPDDARARASAARAVEVALADHGLQGVRPDVTIRCGDSECLTRDGLVTVTVAVAVPLPLVPAMFGASSEAAVPVTASATQRVSRFWGTR